jgi:hypothetical protein
MQLRDAKPEAHSRFVEPEVTVFVQQVQPSAVGIPTLTKKFSRQVGVLDVHT